MKKIIYSVLTLGMLSCTNGEVPTIETEVIANPFVTISGKITNLLEADLIIKNRKIKFEKVIHVKEDGTFSDTLIIPDTISNYTFTYGEEYGNLYLENGNTLSFTIDTEQFDESLNFEGSNANENNFLVKKVLSNEGFDFMGLAMVTEEYFEDSLQLELDRRTNFLTNGKNLSEKFINSEIEKIASLKDFVADFHIKEIERVKTIELLKGKLSPSFVNYTTPDDQLVASDKYIGKYTYIDVWATWCAPCRAEIPAIKEFLTTENGTKINVLSISVDEEDATDKWKKMVVEEEMNWHQLKADSAWESGFIQAYAINSIPRFILLDPKGHVVNADAPRPSSEEFKTMIEELNL